MRVDLCILLSVLIHIYVSTSDLEDVSFAHVMLSNSGRVKLVGLSGAWNHAASVKFTE